MNTENCLMDVTPVGGQLPIQESFYKIDALYHTALSNNFEKTFCLPNNELKYKQNQRTFVVYFILRTPTALIGVSLKKTQNISKYIIKYMAMIIIKGNKTRLM